MSQEYVVENIPYNVTFNNVLTIKQLQVIYTNSEHTTFVLKHNSKFLGNNQWTTQQSQALHFQVTHPNDYLYTILVNEAHAIHPKPNSNFDHMKRFTVNQQLIKLDYVDGSNWKSEIKFSR